MTTQIYNLSTLPWRGYVSTPVFVRDGEVGEESFASRIKAFRQEINILWFFKVYWDKIGKAWLGRPVLNHMLACSLP